MNEIQESPNKQRQCLVLDCMVNIAKLTMSLYWLIYTVNTARTKMMAVAFCCCFCSFGLVWFVSQQFSL